MSAKKIPLRMCLGCREMKPKKELARIVKTPDGEIKVDFTGRLNGRGAYICKDEECLKKVKKANSLAHTFSLPISEDIYSRLETELNEDEQK